MPRYMIRKVQRLKNEWEVDVVNVDTGERHLIRVDELTLDKIKSKIKPSKFEGLVFEI